MRRRRRGKAEAAGFRCHTAALDHVPTIQTCCRPISKAIPRQRNAANRICGNRFIHAKAPTSAIVIAGQAFDQDGRPTARRTYVRQAVATLSRFGENYTAVLGRGR
jgi:hypothetical protein